MKVTTEVKTDLAKGLKILRQAVSNEKQACRGWAQYAKWVVDEAATLHQIAGQLMEVKGWKPIIANKNARSIVLLGAPENRLHLEGLMNGDYDFSIACLKVNPTKPRKANYQDDEAAVHYAQKAIVIIGKQHKEWSLEDHVRWFTSICEPLIKQKQPSNG